MDVWRCSGEGRGIGRSYRGEQCLHPLDFRQRCQPRNEIWADAVQPGLAGEFLDPQRAISRPQQRGDLLHRALTRQFADADSPIVEVVIVDPAQS